MRSWRNVRPVTPRQFPDGLTGWYDATSLRGIYADGAAVATWHDLSGGGRNLTEATNRPTFRDATGAGSLPGVDFDGTNDRLASSVALSNFLTVGAKTVIAVFTTDTADVDNVGYATEAVWGDVGGGYLGMAVRGSTPKQLQIYNYDTNLDTIGSGGLSGFDNRVGIGNPSVAWMIHTGGVMYGHYDGLTSASVATGNTGSLAGNLRLGANYAAAAFFDGKIHEIAFWNRALSINDVFALKDSLEQKWSVKVGGY